MAWPKKNTKRISIDGTEYLWRVKDYSREKALTVQRESIPGKYLIVIFPDNESITPVMVRQFIEEALSLGWLSIDSSSQDFWMRGSHRVHKGTTRDWKN